MIYNAWQWLKESRVHILSAIPCITVLIMILSHPLSFSVNIHTHHFQPNRKRYHRSSSDEKSIAIGWSEVPAPRVWLGTSRSSSFSVFTFTSDDLMRDKPADLVSWSRRLTWEIGKFEEAVRAGKGWDGGRSPFPVGCGPCDTWRRVSTWLRFAANCPRYGTELGMKPPYRHRTSPVCTPLVQNITDNIVSR